MAVQNNVSSQAQHEVNNPTLLQQALLHHDMRTSDGTAATQVAETSKDVRKSRKMRELSDNFQKPQIEVTHATVARRLAQKYATGTPAEKEAILKTVGQLIDKRNGGNIFLEIAQMEEQSMQGNQASLIGKMSQEQADQTQMSNLNTHLQGLAHNMQDEAKKAESMQSDAAKKRQTGQDCTYAGIGLGAALIVANIVLACIPGGALVAIGLDAAEGAAAAGEATAGTLAATEGAEGAGSAVAAAGDSADATATSGDSFSAMTASPDDVPGADGGEIELADTNPSEIPEGEDEVPAENTPAGESGEGEGADSTSAKTEEETEQSETNWKKTLEKAAANIKKSMGRGFQRMFATKVSTGLTLGAAAGAVGGLTAGGILNTAATNLSSDASAQGGFITADSTEAQVLSNDNTVFNQDISQQNTYVQQLNDANSSAASFIKTAASQMQQVQSLGNMY